MALGWALLAKLALVLPANYFTDPLFLISQAGVTVNLVLMLLNLIPLLPLDGGRIVAGLLPDADGGSVRAARALGLPDPARADVHATCSGSSSGRWSPARLQLIANAFGML